MKKYKTYQKLLVCILPFVLIFVIYFSAILVLKYIKFPPCVFYIVTGINCPGCGATRSVNALLNGDLLLSLRQNAMIISSILVGLVFYIELLVNVVFEKKISFFKFNIIFAVVVTILFIVYSILRNIFPILAPM